MNFQTKIPLSRQSHNLIDYTSNILLLGSCFAENIGNKLEYFKFQNTLNPFGILFHPVAIENLITRAINLDYYSEEELFNHNEIWHCFDAHSQLSSMTQNELLISLNVAIDSTHKLLKDVTHIIITLGTAWVYRHIETDRLVASCHKVPQTKFLKELLSVEKIASSLEASATLIKSVNPDVSFIFSVSPVRHLKEGIVANNRAKSHLLAAVHKVVDEKYRQYYFPSYEIVMDELRDYRFYKEDMVHPNNVAIDYIFHKFNEVWIDESSEKIMKKVDEIQKGLQHKPFNPDSELHKLFLRNLESKKEQLIKLYPNIYF
jgi:hypothetical protein